MTTHVRSIASLAAVAALAAACSTAGAAPTASPVPTAAPTATPTATPAHGATPAPTPTPVPSTDGEGDEYVVGTSSTYLSRPFTKTTVDGVTQWRGGVITVTETMNDVRVTGVATATVNVDAYTKVGREWLTVKLVNDKGTWEGSCTAASWDDGNATVGACWLTGTGAYEGWTYYHVRSNDKVQGIVYRGDPPTTTP